MFKKAILIASSVLLVTLSQAQSLSALGKGKKITRISSIKTKTNTEMMGQSMEQAQTMNLKGEITIADVNDKNIILEETTTKLKLNMEVMGQEIEYDSDKPNPKEEFQKLGDMLNKKSTYTCNTLGVITDVQYDKAIEEQLKASASMGAGSTFSVGQQIDFLLVLPKDATVGKSWVVTQTVNETKSDYTYVIQSIENGFAKVEVSAKMDIDKKTEVNGMEMTMKLSGTISGILIVDTKTNLVKTSTTITKQKGTMEVMSQSVPMEIEAIKDDVFE